jgi:hypothetical protein
LIAIIIYKKGNLLVVVVAESRIVSDQVYEYILFAGLLFIATIIFITLINSYNYVEEAKTFGDDDDLSISQSKGLKINLKKKSKLLQKLKEILNNAILNKGFLRKSFLRNFFYKIFSI